MWKIKCQMKNGPYIAVKTIPPHPKARKSDGYIMLHRVIMENHLGRILEDDEEVHHKDENTRNNSIENLEVRLRGEHQRHHALGRGKQVATFKCPNCERIFQKDRSKSHLVNKRRMTFCSIQCQDAFKRFLMSKSETAKERVQRAIAENLIEVFTVYPKFYEA